MERSEDKANKGIENSGLQRQARKEGSAIQWTDGLAVNVLDIDNQHRELFAKITFFFDALDRHEGASEIRELFAYLENYIISHFRTEEAYMDKHLDTAIPILSATRISTRPLPATFASSPRTWTTRLRPALSQRSSGTG